MMRILIANLMPETSRGGADPGSKKKFGTLHFSLGLGIIAAVLERAGRSFNVYDSYVAGTTAGFLESIKRDMPDVILLSGFLGNYTYPFIKDVAANIKKINPAVAIAIGGPMASTIPELLASRTLIDFIVKGEGERTIPELLDAIEINLAPEGVKGVYFKDPSGKIVFTGERERIENLDNYPFPLYDAFTMEPYVNYLRETGRCWEISASRGCYGHCHFCKLTFGQRIAAYSPRVVVNHMIRISERYGIDRFNFVDDNFLNTSKRIDEFISVLKAQPQKFKWRFQGRADKITPDLVEKMAEAGLYDISFGIESGSQEMLDRYGKRLDIKKAHTNLAAIRDVVDIHATFIVGGPGEDWDTIAETENFIKRLKLKYIGVGILTLFPGTVLYDHAKRGGIIGDENEYCMNLGPVYDRPYVNISDLSDSELLSARDRLMNAALSFEETSV